MTTQLHNELLAHLKRAKEKPKYGIALNRWGFPMEGRGTLIKLMILRSWASGKLDTKNLEDQYQRIQLLCRSRAVDDGIREYKERP